MGQAIGDVLPAAVGVGLSPIAIVAVILMVVSPMARTNGPAFLLGWIVGIAVIVGPTVLLASPDGFSGEEGDPATASLVVHLVLGLVLLFLAFNAWKKRPTDEEPPPMPNWMGTIDKVTPLAALGLGAMLSSVYPKSFLFNVAAGTLIAQADLAASAAIVPIVVYVLVASVSVGGPVVWYLAAPQRAAKTLEGWKSWLIANNATITTVLLLVFGVMLAGQGLGGLIG